MADEKFRVDNVGVDLDGLADDLKNQKADFYSESVFDFPEEPSSKTKTPIDDSSLSSSYSEKKTTTRRETTEEVLDTSDLIDEEDTDQTVEDYAKTMPIEPNENDFVSPIEQDNDLGNIPEQEEDLGLPDESNNMLDNENKSPLNKEDIGNNKELADKAKDAKDKIPNDKMSKMPNLGNKNNPLDQIPKKEKQEQPEEAPPQEEKKEIDKSPSERRKEKEQRDTDNNTNNVRNAAEVAIATHDPTATAIGTIVKKADELTDGKSSELLGKALTINNKHNPAGKQL